MRRRISPAIQGKTEAVTGAMKALARLEKDARKARDGARERYGFASREHTRAMARHAEADRIMHGVYRLLQHRLKELENPREGGHEWID